MTRPSAWALPALLFCFCFPGIAADRKGPSPLELDYLKRAADADFRGLTARHGLDGQIARMELARPIDAKVFEVAMEFIATGGDMVDFALTPMMRILYRYPGRVPPELKARMERTVLDFRYWLYAEEGDVHSSACLWTENHQVLYHSLEYLAGQMFPDRTFTKTGKPGRWHMEHGRRKLLAWMAVRARYGFSEWLSAGYYNQDFAAMLNLVDFARDPLIANSTARIADLALLDIALHSFDGGLRCAMGRPYSSMLKDGRTTASAAILMLATDVPNPLAPVADAAGAVFLATSKYRVPPVIPAVAKFSGPVLIRESFGWDPAEGIAWDWTR